MGGGSATGGGSAVGGGSATGGGTASGAPRVLSLSVLPARLYRNDPGASTFSALVTDPDGLQDVVGGRLVDPVSGGTYGVFTAAGSPGAYTFSIDWLTMQAVRGVTAAGVQGLERDFRAEFFDIAGNVGSGSVTMLLHCGLTGYGVCNNQCRQLGTSTNCSICDEVVPVGGACVNYTPTCPAGGSVCNGACVDLQNDSNNCGGCGVVVPTGRVCRNGAPACANATDTWCPAQNVCANLQTSASNCGACGAAVPAPRSCVDGLPACGNNETYCSAQNACANLQTSSAHCGACGNAVSRGCVAGTITPKWSLVRNPVTDSTPAPAGRYFSAMVYDASRGAMVLFGGEYGSSLQAYGDTWTWDGTAWTQLTLSPSPSARGMHGMAYDEVRQRVVLYGGYTTSVVNDLWELGPTGWQQRSQNGSLPLTADPTTLTWDSVRQRVVIMKQSSGAIWEWDGTTWTQRPVSTGASANYGVSGFDPVRNRLQLVGNGGIYVFNGTGWNLAAGNGPQNTGGTIAFDTVRNRSILFAQGPSGNMLSQTWEWSGSSWTSMNTWLSTRPVAVGGPATAWDPVRHVMVLFGGSDCRSSSSCFDSQQTWEYGQ